jgi:hypothetical protein
MADDYVNHPPHYKQGDIECIDAIKAALGNGFQYYLQGSIIKYIWRFEHKENPLQDLQKASWYLDKLVGEIKGGKD